MTITSLPDTASMTIEDVQGRAMLIHSRIPHSMHDLGRILLSLPLGIVAAQHLEGGPEGQLVYRDGDGGVALIGPFEPERFEPGEGSSGWPVPNVLGIVARDRSR